MKTLITITSLGCIAAGLASAQSFVAGLDFKNPESFITNKTFDTGAEKDFFTLNTQSNADDNYSFFNGGSGTTFTQDAWAAAGEQYTDGVNNFNAGANAFLPVTVQNSFGGGANPSTSVFGETSAFAQGFSNTQSIAFLQDGFFTISVGKSFLDVSINFEVAALAVDSQSAGTLLVDGNSVNVTSAFANQTVNLGDLTAGDLITFDLSGLSGGATFDNFMIAGTVVPEPSTYAGIFGVIALGFAAFRRRKAA